MIYFILLIFFAALITLNLICSFTYMSKRKTTFCVTSLKKAAQTELQDQVRVLSTSQVQSRTGNTFKHLPLLRSEHDAPCAITVCSRELTRNSGPGKMPCSFTNRSPGTWTKGSVTKALWLRNSVWSWTCVSCNIYPRILPPMQFNIVVPSSFQSLTLWKLSWYFW